jgi:hypothetical protein
MKCWLEFRVLDDDDMTDQSLSISIDVREVVAVVEEVRDLFPVAQIHLRAVGASAKVFVVHDPERTVARQIRVASMDCVAWAVPGVLLQSAPS